MIKSARYEIKKRFFKRAVRENRGADAISKLLIAERRYRQNAEAAKADRPLVELFLKENEGNARSICAMNLIAEKSGSRVRFQDRSASEQKQEGAKGFDIDGETLCAHFRFFGQALTGRKKEAADFGINTEGERVFSEIDEGCLDLSSFFKGGKNKDERAEFDFLTQAEKRDLAPV